MGSVCDRGGVRFSSLLLGDWIVTDRVNSAQIVFYETDT